jgi:hypothetical protein
MFIEGQDNCLDTLIDLLCYEMSCGRLSPETEALLDGHLEHCAGCRKRVYDFLALIDGASGSLVPTTVN